VPGILFCNIGWMIRYEGLAGKPDKNRRRRQMGPRARDRSRDLQLAVGNDGYVYGHVETIHGEADGKIRLESIGVPASRLAGST
jgi:hypothetical protein